MIAKSLTRTGIRNETDNAINEGLIANGKLRTGIFYTIGNVLEKKAFVPYNFDGKENCNTCAREQNNVSVKGSDSSLQMLLKDKKGVYSNPDFNEGINYLKKSLPVGNSIMVGAHTGNIDIGNTNSLTGHFFNIVGMGYDPNKGNYFSYYDNAHINIKLGTNLSANRLYFGTIKNTKTRVLIDRNIPRSKVPYYILTEVRPNY